MSRSYRKPYGTVCSVGSSAHGDKTTAARCMRRAQNQSLREAIRDEDWDGWLIPERYECSFNDVWGWGRDGKQRLLHQGSQYNNPYAYVCSPTYWDYDELMKRWFDHMQRDDEYMADASRK